MLQGAVFLGLGLWNWGSRGLGFVWFWGLRFGFRVLPGFRVVGVSGSWL